MNTSRGGALVTHGRFIVRVAAVLAACLTAASLLASGVFATGISDEARACGGARNTVQAEFDLASGQDIWREFPAMLQSPELESESAPLHVVVFKGDVDLTGMVMGTTSQVPLVTNAVCVTLSSGQVFFYDGVSRAGSRFQ